MKKVRIRMTENCRGTGWWYGIYVNNRRAGLSSDYFSHKGYVIRAAKKMAKILNIKFDPKIIKQHGC